MYNQVTERPGTRPENQNVQGMIYDVVNAEALIAILKQNRAT